MPTIVCDTCGKPFHVRPSRIGIRRRCSVACKDTRIAVACERCGKTFLRASWHREKCTRSFCSRACSRAPHTADFIGTQPRHAIHWGRFDSWSADLAYFLGLMLSDGSVRETGAVNFVSIDRCSVEFVRDFVSSDSLIREETTRTGTIAYRWSVWSKPLVDILGRYGILPRKSLTVRLPVIPDALFGDFARGLLDGDGSVDRNGRASFATGSEGFALDLTAALNHRGITAVCRKVQRSFAVQLNIGPSRLLAAMMYRDACPHLARKRSRFH